jgi:hypothetical protein
MSRRDYFPNCSGSRYFIGAANAVEMRTALAGFPQRLITNYSKPRRLFCPKLALARFSITIQRSVLATDSSSRCSIKFADVDK